MPLSGSDLVDIAGLHKRTAIGESTVGHRHLQRGDFDCAESGGVRHRPGDAEAAGNVLDVLQAERPRKPGGGNVAGLFERSSDRHQAAAATTLRIRRAPVDHPGPLFDDNGRIEDGGGGIEADFKRAAIEDRLE